MMAEPWGISGTQFVWWYLAGLVVAVLATARGRRRIRSTDPARPTHPLDLHEVAYLAGGPTRTAQTAVADLLDRGVLRIARNRRLSGTGLSVEGAVDRAVLHAVRTPRRSPSAKRVILVVAYRPEITRIGDRLVEAGLLVHRPNGIRRLWVAALPLFVLVATGLVRLLNVLALDRPAGVLTFLLILSLITTTVMLSPPKVWRTVAGNALLTEVKGGRVSSNRGSSPAVVAMTGAAALVAMNGFSAFPDPTIRVALSRPAHSGGSSSGSCSSYSCGGSSGASCGGGGSSCGGGGGGGGCGGG